MWAFYRKTKNKLSIFSSYLGSSCWFYIPTSTGLNCIHYLDVFQYPFIWSCRNFGWRSLLFSRCLIVLWITDITQPRQRVSISFVTFKNQLNLASFHMLQPCFTHHVRYHRCVSRETVTSLLRKIEMCGGKRWDF